MADYTQHLLPYLDPARLKTLSCGHVIPDTNLLACPVVSGPNNIEFDFTFDKRNLPSVIDELGNTIVELSRVIPDGVVVFFPSYAYLEKVTTRWEMTGKNGKSIKALLACNKKLFRESKESFGGDEILRDYAQTIDAGTGALLLSVVGGKLSEGINFSDKLGRGVVIVGLPYPNIQSAQWKAKLDYIEHAMRVKGGSEADGKAASREFYENACMRAVNQSVGRAIRHKKDYATIVMLDRRYNTPRIKSKLPVWIQRGLRQSSGEKDFAQLIRSIGSFF